MSVLVVADFSACRYRRGAGGVVGGREAMRPTAVTVVVHRRCPHCLHALAPVEPIAVISPPIRDSLRLC